MGYKFTKNHKEKLKEAMLRNKLKLQPKKCLQCGIIFQPNSSSQKFHNDSCAAEYRSKHKKVTEFPGYICCNCKKKFQLNFDPIKNLPKLKFTKCPYCKEIASSSNNNKI